MRRLSFYDFERMDWISPTLSGQPEFSIGEYDTDVGSVLPLGEFRLVLHDFSGTSGKPALRNPAVIQVCTFNDGIGALRLAMALADAHGVDLTGDVDERSWKMVRLRLSERLLGIGLLDRSDKLFEPALEGGAEPRSDSALPSSADYDPALEGAGIGTQPGPAPSSAGAEMAS